MTKKKDKDLALEKIESEIEKIDKLWKKITDLADKAGVSFWYSDPADRFSARYYPRRPDDWTVWNEWDHTGDDPNRDHPDHEDYHPWNDCYEREFDWDHGNWVSSSDRC